MSGLSSRPWSEDEKIFLLTEILRDARFSSSFLFALIRDYNVPIRWNEIPLPPGRSLSSCQTVFNDISQNLPPEYAPRLEPAPNLQRPGAAAIPQVPQKRPLAQAETSVPGTRALQPRPAAIGTLSPSTATELQSPAQSSPGDPAADRPRKKRGRPSKLEVEERIAAAEARGEIYQPPKRRTPKSKQTINESNISATAESTPGSAGMAPQYQTPESQRSGEATQTDWRRQSTKSDFPGPLLHSAGASGSMPSPGEPRPPFPRGLYSQQQQGPYEHQQPHQLPPPQQLTQQQASPRLASHHQHSRSVQMQQYPETSYRPGANPQQQQGAQQAPSTPDVKMREADSPGDGSRGYPHGHSQSRMT